MLPGGPAGGRCLVMGVVNVTPDSFSDGGAWYGTDAAVRRGLQLAAQGADLVDVGGESTRPGAQRVSDAEELRRVIPVISALAAAGVLVSVDTMRTRVAEAALAAGACLVNDVSGGLADPQMPRLVAKAGVAYVVMHWRGHSHDMMQRAVYGDVVRDVSAELRHRVDTVIGEGVDPSRIILDPGLGFAKRPAHNWALLTRLDEIAALGGDGPRFPVLIGASRKSFLGKLLAGPDGTPRSFLDSDGATVAVTALAAAAGAWAVRVHEVPDNADAVRVAMAWRGSAASPSEPGRPAGLPPAALTGHLPAASASLPPVGPPRPPAAPRPVRPPRRRPVRPPRRRPVRPPRRLPVRPPARPRSPDEPGSRFPAGAAGTRTARRLPARAP